MTDETLFAALSLLNKHDGDVDDEEIGMAGEEEQEESGGFERAFEEDS